MSGVGDHVVMAALARRMALRKQGSLGVIVLAGTRELLAFHHHCSSQSRSVVSIEGRAALDEIVQHWLQRIPPVALQAAARACAATASGLSPGDLEAVLRGHDLAHRQQWIDSWALTEVERVAGWVCCAVADGIEGPLPVPREAHARAIASLLGAGAPALLLDLDRNLGPAVVAHAMASAAALAELLTCVPVAVAAEPECLAAYFVAPPESTAKALARQGLLSAPASGERGDAEAPAEGGGRRLARPTALPVSGRPARPSAVEELRHGRATLAPPFRGGARPGGRESLLSGRSPGALEEPSGQAVSGAGPERPVDAGERMNVPAAADLLAGEVERPGAREPVSTPPERVRPASAPPVPIQRWRRELEQLAESARGVVERLLLDALAEDPRTRDQFEFDAPVEILVDSQAARVSLLCRPQRIAVEVEPFQYVRSADSRRRAHRKAVLLQQHGYLVLRLPAEEVVTRTADVVDSIAEALVGAAPATGRDGG